MRVLELLVVAVCLQAVQADKDWRWKLLRDRTSISEDWTYWARTYCSKKIFPGRLKIEQHWGLESLEVLVSMVGDFPEDNIVKLTKFNFDENVKRGTWMVKFYAPWCSHCQRLKPIWEKLADHAVSQEWPVKIAEVDCTVSKNICQKANVKGFPEVVLITDGKPKGKYKGEVGSAKAFEAWLSKQGVLGDSTAAIPKYYKVVQLAPTLRNFHVVSVMSPPLVGSKSSRAASAETVDSAIPSVTRQEAVRAPSRKSTQSMNSKASKETEGRDQRGSTSSLASLQEPSGLGRLFGLYKFQQRVSLARSVFASFTRDSRSNQLLSVQNPPSPRIATTGFPRCARPHEWRDIFNLCYVV
eukprot:g11663.t1